MAAHSQPELTWKDGVIPVATAFDDPYFSLRGGFDETRHVFLDGNRLAERLQDGFHVAELGFGTGLNLLTLALLWQGLREHQGREGEISFTTFEAFPMAAGDMARALAHFPEAAAIAEPLIAQIAAGKTEIALDGIRVKIVLGDVRETLPAWQHHADCWFLDGFSPAKNPEMWGDDLMVEVATHTKAGGTFATYTAAGHVRRSLAAAGFEVSRQAGFAGKRHMSVGVKRATSAPE